MLKHAGMSSTSNTLDSTDRQHDGPRNGQKAQTCEEEGFKDELRTAVQNNVNQWAQSNPSLGEWVKENETLKILEVVLLRLP